MKAKIKRNYLGTFLILIPENRKEKDELLGLWQKIPDITFVKRGSISGDVPIRIHSFVIEIKSE